MSDEIDGVIMTSKNDLKIDMSTCVDEADVVQKNLERGDCVYYRVKSLTTGQEEEIKLFINRILVPRFLFECIDENGNIYGPLIAKNLNTK